MLRLDRIGDVLMSPARARRPARGRCPRPGSAWPWAAGARARAAAPGGRGARVERALGGPPRGGRRGPGRPRSARRARLRSDRLDLALDLQGDVRASLLLWLTGAARARGLRQHRRRLPAHRRGAPGRDRLLGRAEPARGEPWRTGPRPPRPSARCPRRPAHPRGPGLRGGVPRAEAGLRARRPLVGIHPSGGRRVKQWPVERWREVARAAAARARGRRSLVTGSAADRARARAGRGPARTARRPDAGGSTCGRRWP